MGFFDFLTPGVGTVASTLLGGAASAYGAKKQQDANVAATQKQMDFQERMSSTAYQRSMADMRKAGLNPILAYQKGGASSPSGGVIPAINQAEQAVQSALQIKRLSADLKLLTEQTYKIKQEGRERKALADRAEILNIGYTTARQMIAQYRSSQRNDTNAKDIGSQPKGRDDPIGVKLKNLYKGKLDTDAWEARARELKDKNFHKRLYK